MAKITMFAYDNVSSKRFNRYHLEDFIEQENCSVDLWNKLKEDLDKTSYNYTTLKKQKITFQVGKIQNSMQTGFIIIWGYGLNDNDVNDKGFINFVNDICKKGIIIINKTGNNIQEMVETQKNDTNNNRVRTLNDMGFIVVQPAKYERYIDGKRDAIYFDTENHNIKINLQATKDLTAPLIDAIYEKTDKYKLKDAKIINVDFI